MLGDNDAPRVRNVRNEVGKCRKKHQPTNGFWSTSSFSVVRKMKITRPKTANILTKMILADSK